MTGAQRIVSPDAQRGGNDPRVTGEQSPDAPRAARPTGEQRGASDPRMTGAQRVVPPDAPRAARPTGDQADPRMTGAQRVVQPDAPRAARPTGEQRGANDPRSTPTIGVPRSIPRQESGRSDPRIVPPRAPGVGWASDAYDEEALADAERAAASGLIAPPREPLRPRR